MEVKVREAGSHGYRVCVVDAAVLVMAGWHRRVHQIWTTLAPRSEVRVQWVWFIDCSGCIAFRASICVLTFLLLPFVN